jgi:hypothetical protein
VFEGAARLLALAVAREEARLEAAAGDEPRIDRERFLEPRLRRDPVAVARFEVLRCNYGRLNQKP